MCSGAVRPREQTVLSVGLLMLYLHIARYMCKESGRIALLLES